MSAARAGRRGAAQGRCGAAQGQGRGRPGAQRRAFVAGVLAVVPFVAVRSAAQEPITVVSWGGSYARACVLGYHENFVAETGIPINLEDYNGGLAQIRAQVEVGAVHWDVVDMDIDEAVQGCDEGLLEPLDPDIFAPGPDGAPATDDFRPGTWTECGVGTSSGSSIYAFSTETFPDERPSTIDDFFDLEKFPGRRSMRRVPNDNMEFALMADGVAVEDLYAVLETPQGRDRAFRKLDEIKEHVIWWEAGAQPPQMLADGEVVMSTAWNGRIFNAQVLEGQPLEIVWDGQIKGVNQLVVVAGTPRLESALRFISFATRPESMAGIAGYIAYSPARRSAQAMVSVHRETGVEMASHMPTNDRPGRSLERNHEWWSNHKDEFNERFSAWLARR